MNKIIYLVCALEGFVLMANELISSKLMASAFGSSIYTWVVLLSCTLVSLALGYVAGGKIASSFSIKKAIILLLATLFLFQVFYLSLSSALSEVLLHYSLLMGSVLFCLLSLGPIVFLLGALTPLFVNYIEQLKPNSNQGVIAGRVYGFSTLGGVLSTFLFGLTYLPNKGLNFSNKFVVVCLLVALVLFSFLNLINVKEGSKNSLY